jgi:mannose-6-phosphate isomerase-like protein (cupin superfamily)
VLVLVSPGASHAVRNDGDSNLWLVAISSETYDPAESVVRKVV